MVPPYCRLQEAGAEVKIVGSGGKEVFESKHGYPVTADLSINDVRLKISMLS